MCAGSGCVGGSVHVLVYEGRWDVGRKLIHISNACLHARTHLHACRCRCVRVQVCARMQTRVAYVYTRACVSTDVCA